MVDDNYTLNDNSFDFTPEYDVTLNPLYAWKDPVEFYKAILSPSDNNLLGFEFLEEEFDGVTIMLNMQTINLVGDKFKFEFTIKSNPNNISNHKLQGPVFADLVQRSVNHLLTRVEETK